MSPTSNVTFLSFSSYLTSSCDGFAPPYSCLKASTYSTFSGKLIVATTSSIFLSVTFDMLT